MGSSKISNSVKSAADIQRLDTSYFIPWQLDMLYEIEPELENVAKRATWRKHRQFANKLEAYSIAKHEADFLVGWFARDPRLRSQGAWDCFFDYILDELGMCVCYSIYEQR